MKANNLRSNKTSHIRDFFKTMNVLDVFSAVDHYPGNPYYIGKDESVEDKRPSQFYIDYLDERKLDSVTLSARCTLVRLSLIQRERLLSRVEVDEEVLVECLEKLEALKERLSNRDELDTDYAYFMSIITGAFVLTVHHTCTAPNVGVVTLLLIGDFIRLIKMRLHYLRKFKSSLILVTS